MVRFQKDGKYGFKSPDGRIVTPPEYDHIKEFDNQEITSVLAYSKSADADRYTLDYIDRTGQVILRVVASDIYPSSDCGNFYNGYALFDDQFIDQKGNIVYHDADKRLHGSVGVIYWGNNYYRMYYTPTVDGITLYRNSGLIHITGEVELDNSNIFITGLYGDYALVNAEKWCVVIDKNLDVECVFYNTINCVDSWGVTIPEYLTDISLVQDEITRNPLLKLRKSYVKVTTKDFIQVQGEIQKIFQGHYCPQQVKEFYFPDAPECDGLSRQEYFEIEDTFQYEYLALNQIGQLN